MKILVTGGTGFIGSHTVVELIAAGHTVEILDNLCNSKEAVLNRLFDLTGVRVPFYQADLLDLPALAQIFQEGHFDAVIHFAGLKAVGESVEQPLMYYENNVCGTVNLLKAMQAGGTRKIIFSSSATVYGEPGTPAYSEDLPTGQHIPSPYGKTKYMIEEILKDVAKADPEFSAVILRYFNPVGAHPSGLLGEDPNGRPNNLMPIIMRVYQGRIPELSVYGDDYPTSDGTCIRDYIHVVDLAKGHVKALAALGGSVSGSNQQGSESSGSTSTPSDPKQPSSGRLCIYNLGSGKGTSVLEMIAAFEAASGKKLPYKIAPRRPGDLPEFYAVPDKALKDLGWQTELSIEDAMRDTLNFLEKES